MSLVLLCFLYKIKLKYWAFPLSVIIIMGSIFAYKMPYVSNRLKIYLNPELDIRGKVCPMTFVYTKLALEEMNKGQIIEILLDFPPAIDNIPESCKRQDLAEVLEIKKIDKKNNVLKLILRKI